MRILRALYRSVFLIILLLLMLTGICLAQEYKDVTVTGTSEITGGNEEGAKKLAVRDALRNAVEMGVGVVIQSKTDVKDFEVIKDEIKSNAEGFVKEYDILKEGAKGGRYSVTMRAKVMTERISEAFKKRLDKASAALGQPSITFVLTTWRKIGEKGASTTKTEQVDVNAKRRDQTQIEGSVEEKLSTDSKYSASEKQAGQEKYDVSTTEKANAKYKVSASEKEKASVKASGRASATEDSATLSGDAQVSTQYEGKAKVGYEGSSSESGKASYESSQKVSGEAKTTDSASYGIKGKMDKTQSVDASSKVTKTTSSAYRLSEIEWKKYPDMTIIDSFNQEFKEKGFDLKATDEARKTALSASLAQTEIDVFDREQVRRKAEKEGANFVARGEVQIIDYQISESTGNHEVRSKVGIEIIDVNSGDIVSAYSNTTKASSRSREDADAQSIKSIAVLAARALAGQTLQTWEKRASTGQYFTIEVRNISNIRKQQRPLLKALESIASIRQHTNPSQNVLLMEVSYKGNKAKLGEAIIDKIENVPGFSANEFEGPIIEGGKIVFKFMK